MTEASREPRKVHDTLAALEGAARVLIAVWRRAQDATEHIPPSQLRAMEAVERRAELNLRDLAGELGVIPSSASRLCDRLEAAGLLARRGSDADRRQITLRLTLLGERSLHELSARRRRDLHEVLARMTPDGRERLLHGLLEFARAAESRLE
ncbi:MarR family winged helix-turn-helix transcriptional regulator [Actinomadura hibisca]|uniref:MarR family winged helix-turn-helix transcriptional regulator n=1 Tax=Actinomadura hibisca TaxID=68565 RepID=UPI000830BE38|nr:MarR family transcriptional regulator [Actinomadura hibisca]